MTDIAPTPVDVAEVRRRLPGARRLVVLDDDPTGTQTVRGVPVLTRWTDEDLRWAFAAGGAGFFVLTNTRSLGPAEAAARVREVVAAARAAGEEAGVDTAFVARGDSTLRGHFPLETDAITALETAAGRPTDAVLLVPAYIDAGRITVDGVHLVRDGDRLVPVGETEFARDRAFGYRASRLDEWTEEASGGAVPAAEVALVDLEGVRSGAVATALARGGVVAPDAVVDDDLRAVAVAVLDAEARGTRVVTRSGPSYVRARLGQRSAPPIADDELRGLVDGGPGLVVVGSHVDRTSAQLARLVADLDPAVVELPVDAVVDGDPEPVVERAVRAAVAALDDRTVVLHTSRARRDGADAADGLRIARAVSAALTRAVAGVVSRRRPAFVVAKGGITSSDVATDALGIRRATVRGSLLPGIVSLWQAEDGPAAGLPYVVFAGNVGDEGALTAVVRRLSAR